MTILKNTLSLLAVAGLMTIGSAVAQTSSGNGNTSGAGPGVHDPNHPRVNQINRREQRQQNRIANGIKNDKLNSRQASRLEKGETRLQNNEKRDMSKDNGHLTRKNQRQLNHEANRMSRRIKKDKTGS
ncbi:MAG TPA: hypothetical protein VKY85_23350 [Candidatus Angelobacter sp.]|nr:hypothetical protein [Candidatus Angelobacter sp.]